ncbi:TetR/AcrR family transcriptional regulator [uncultured Leifsonia sp.]|uniref:TetR/AcrR family transcriptional regulator n=1 Tax=uncultured Leifsonia sp. TaxID=340359 RepID=UPI0025E4E2C2|nr:TetR/AcrR family transcriptional regulator [uncultured Leifsonia sp.]
MESQPTRAQRREATAEKILRAAQDEFGDRGVDGATIRGIARRAGVDPSLVLQHYGSKQALFELAVRPVDDLRDDDVSRHLAEVLDVRLRELPAPTRALMRSMLTSPDAAAVMREYLEDRAEVLAAASRQDDARLRAELIVAAILGVTIARHFLELPALTAADGDTAARILEPLYAGLR